MSPFTIHCTTCHAKLKVRDASAVGQILGCPKCGSMVLVEPPKDLVAPVPTNNPASNPTSAMPNAGPVAAAPQASPGLQDTILDPAMYDNIETQAPLLDDPAKPAIPAKTLPAERSADLSCSDSGITLTPAAEKTAAGSAVSAKAVPLESASASPTAWANPSLPSDAAVPPLPLDNWNSATAQQWRQWLALGGAAIGGIALAVGLFGFYISRREPPGRDREAQSPPVAAADHNSNGFLAGAPKPSDATTPDGDQPAPTQPAAEVEPVSSPPGTSDSVSPDPDPPDGPSQAASPSPRASAAGEADANDVSTAPSESSPPDPVDKPDAEDKANGPPDLTPRENALANADSDPAGEKPAARQPLPDQVAAVTPTIDFSAITEFVPGSASQFGREPSSNLGPRRDDKSTAEAAELSPPAPAPVNVAARLADPIPSMEMTDAPLADFIQFLTDFSTIPITIDVESLGRRGAVVELPVSVKRTDTNVAGVLAAALEPAGLVFEARGAQLVVRAASVPGRERQAFPAADLAADDVTLQQLVEMVKTLVEPAAWNAAQGTLHADVGQKQLIVDHDSATAYQVGLFLDRLRVARDIRPRGDYPERQLALAPSHLRAKSALTTKVMANFNRPTRLMRILNYLGERTQTRIVADWEALASVGWTPATQTSVVIQNQTLAEGLDKLLSPLELAYYAFDERTLVVTSPAAAAERYELSFHALERPADDQAAQQTLADLRASLGEANFADGRMVLQFDSAGKYLIARLARPQQAVLSGLLAVKP